MSRSLLGPSKRLDSPGVAMRESISVVATKAEANRRDDEGALRSPLRLEWEAPRSEVLPDEEAIIEEIYRFISIDK